METFFKWCPPELYDPARGGARVDSRNYLRFYNGAEIYWLHLDDGDAESVARGLEVNTIFIDQAEEITEYDYDHMNARVGRWDKAEVPPGTEHLYKKDAMGNPMIPAYMLLAVNPDSFDHWVYKRFHEDSPEFNTIRMVPDVTDPELKRMVPYKWSDDHKMYHGKSTENKALSAANLSVMLQKDESFIKRFVKGEWGIPGGAIHHVSPLSILGGPKKTPEGETVYEEVPIELLDQFMINGTLFRAMDHGYSDPTCVLWFSVYKNWILCYREYYKSDEFISNHRTNIAAMSTYAGFAEQYAGNIADPDIFKKRSEKNNELWSVADEYTNTQGIFKDCPPIHWEKGDNNEFMTRNQINELLKVRMDVEHPITGEKGAPSLYFLHRSPAFPLACEQAISQIRAQKKKQIGVVNGQAIYSDEREEKGTPDHAYDPIRYFVAGRPKYKKIEKIAVRPGSFDYEADEFDRANRLIRSGRVAAVGRYVASRY